MPCEVDKALLKCAGKDELYPSEMGVYYDVDSQCKVATNRNVLVVVPGTEIYGLNRVVYAKGNDLEKDFPNYRGVIPTTPSKSIIHNLDAKVLLAKVRGAIRASAFCKGCEVLVVLEDAEGLIAFYPKMVELALIALISTGTSSVTLEAGGTGKCTLLRDSENPDKLALIMPALFGHTNRRHEEDELIYTYLTPRSFE